MSRNLSPCARPFMSIVALVLATASILTLGSCASAPAREPQDRLQESVHRYFAERDIPEFPSTLPKLHFSSGEW
ncbi:MAG: hypothetical protein WCX13_04545, partial [Candidatus Hydrogenedentales bacterium]